MIPSKSRPVTSPSSESSHSGPPAATATAPGAASPGPGPLPAQAAAGSTWLETVHWPGQPDSESESVPRRRRPAASGPAATAGISRSPGPVVITVAPKP